MAEKKLIRFDWAIKYILRNKANFDVLEAFLTNLLKETITIENIDENEINQEAETSKFNRVDLNCKDSQGRQIIIEIQNQREVDYYLQKLLWGTSKVVIENSKLGQAYKEAHRLISVSIFYHNMWLDEMNNNDFIYYGARELTGWHTNKPLILRKTLTPSKQMAEAPERPVFSEYYMIFAEKFHGVISEDIDEWVYFFKHSKSRDDFKSPGIQLATRKLDYLTMNESERRTYDSYLADLGRELSIIETAKAEGWEEGWKEGWKISQEEIKSLCHKFEVEGASLT